MKLRLLALLCLLPISVSAQISSQITLPKILSDHMVVQRDLPVHVWGMAPPGQQVTVTFRRETKSTTAAKLGRWSLYLKPGAAGGPFDMTVDSVNVMPTEGSAIKRPPITIHDILVGDVWVASGQSNMEFPFERASTAATDLPKAGNPKIRLLIVDKKAADSPQGDLSTTGWAASTPESAKPFSAVAWYFAREIEQRQHVPVGVIDSTWGGTPAEAWTSLTALGDDAQINSLFKARGAQMAGAADMELQIKDEQNQIAEAKAQGNPIPQFPWHPALESWGPGNLWNAMIAPVTPFAIRGAIWYQGEANAGGERSPYYDRVMRDLIEDWRRQWGVGPFPFYYVQLANWITDPNSNWADLRDQQRRTLGLRNTAMAVTIDIGNPNDIHPTDKASVGHRLALAARALNYGERDVEYSGPMFRQATTEGGSIRVWFDHAKGLVAKGGAAQGGEVTGVEIAGPDGKYVPAKATIDGDTIVASSPDVPTPVSIRYAWASNPQCNLFNSDNLPASPFSSQK